MNIKLAFDIGLVSTYFDSVLESACRMSASDVHIDPGEDSINIRFRVLGQLHLYARIDIQIKEELVGRIKILAHLRTDIHDRAQDGRFVYLYNAERVELRVSVVPTFYGENAVIRLLRPELRKDLSLASLGLDTSQVALLYKKLKVGRGMILVAGATGSGKTTTIYSCIQELLQFNKNIVTIEDPVEYVIQGVSQIQVQERSFSFTEGLRAVLRQDPEVIVIGEIRDSDTANLAFRAALTGHLVIASIHADQAQGVKDRLLDLGVSKNLLPLLTLIIGQELVSSTNEVGEVVCRVGKFTLITESYESKN
jgi:type IV pilus assembly protein PilB